MNFISIAFLSVFLVLGCTRAPKWKAPAHPSIEVYMSPYHLRKAESIGLPGKAIYSSDSKATAGFGVQQEGKPPYQAEMKYNGTNVEGDHYTITIIYTLNNEKRSIVKEVIYTGTDIELFRDSEYRIGIRPRTSKEKS